MKTELQWQVAGTIAASCVDADMTEEEMTTQLIKAMRAVAAAEDFLLDEVKQQQAAKRKKKSR